jgi:hypothetical protein
MIFGPVEILICIGPTFLVIAVIGVLLWKRSRK